MKKKLVCCFNTHAHSRCFESLPKSKIFDITMVCMPPAKTKVFPGDHRNFLNKNFVYYNNVNEIPMIVKRLNPDVYAISPGNPIQEKITQYPKVCVSHGMVGNHINQIFPDIWNNPKAAWGGYDLYCGFTKRFKKWIVNDSRIKKDVLLNALPQIDLVHQYNNNQKHRAKVVNGNKYKEVILFVGFCCKGRIDFVHNNKDYFDAFKTLVGWAKKNNVLIVTKARQPIEKINQFLIANKGRWGGWTKDYIGMLNKFAKHPNVHWIDGQLHLYWYYFADRVVLNGTSTLEVESVLANKPTIMYKTKDDVLKDSYGLIGADLIKRAKSNEQFIDLLNTCNLLNQTKRKKYIDDQEILFDGKHGQRVVEELEKRYG